MTGGKLGGTLGGTLAGAWLVAAVPAAALDLRVGVAVDRDRAVIALEGGTLAAADVAGSPLPLGRETVIAWVAGEEAAAGDAAGTPAVIYRIQVAAMTDAKKARAEAVGLGRRLSPADAVPDPGSGLLRVRAGRFTARAEADLALQDLDRRRYPGAFVVAEEEAPAAVPEKRGPRLKLALVAADRIVETAGPVTLRPREGSFAAVEGTRYRGTIELRLGQKGLLQVIDAVDLEEYLRGVVPREMGPGQYPEVEALKAQAIAARTYALASRGGSAADGYDLCATARCQVYGGVDGEQPLTDRAVAETRGLALAAAGGQKLITAYFSATCGGHTEDVEKVFESDPPQAYLKGVACGPEPGQAARLPAGTRVPPVARAEDGSPAGPSLALLSAHGIVATGAPGAPGEAWLRAPAPAAEVREWAEKGAALASRAAPDAKLVQPVTLQGLWRYLVEVFALAERGQVLLADADVLALTRARDAEPLAAEARRQAATIALAGALPVLPDGGIHPELHPSRALVLVMIHRLLAGIGAPLLEDAVFVRLEGTTLYTRAAGEDRRDALAPDVGSFRETASGLVPNASGLVLPGDPLRLARRDGQVAVLIVVEGASGADDRRARDSRWSVVLTREELQAKLTGESRVGTVRALKVLGRGASGRPTELELVGSERTARLKGYAIKRTLGLKDDLFVVEPVAGDDGTPRAFRFTGRGWGHGVGLCQEGAYGMALRGASFREILGRYYPGAELVDAAAVDSSAREQGR